jgi:hypothetical protein
MDLAGEALKLLFLSICVLYPGWPMTQPRLKDIAAGLRNREELSVLPTLISLNDF